jgi:flavodoxin
MKSLVIYYSRTGHTAKIAQELADALECDIEEIIDTKKRSGVLGWLRSGRDAGNQSLTVLKDPIKDPANYDLVIIGTPLWAGHVSTPVRTYIHQNQAKFNNVAFFCTAGGNKFSGVFDDMGELSGIAPVATLGVRGKEIKKRTYIVKIEDFIKAIQM